MKKVYLPSFIKRIFAAILMVAIYALPALAQTSTVLPIDTTVTTDSTYIQPPSVTVDSSTDEDKFQAAVEVLREFGVKIDTFDNYQAAIERGLELKNSVPDANTSFKDKAGWFLSVVLAIISAVLLLRRKKK